MVDIIIPQYITTDLTCRCLKAIKKYTHSDYRIVLIDDGTENKQNVNNVVSLLSSLDVPYIFNALDRNYGFAVAVNYGMKLGDSEFFVLMNNDVIVTDGWLNKLLTIIRLDAKIALVAPVTDHIASICRIDKAGTKVGYTSDKDPETFFNSLSSCSFTTSGNVSNFCSLMRRKIVSEVGWYDDRFRIGGGDNDLTDRIREAGYVTHVCLNCFVYHDHGATMKLIPERKRIQHESKLLLQKKRKERKEQRNAS